MKQVLLKQHDKPDVFISDGINKRHIASANEVTTMVNLGLVDRKVHEVDFHVIDALHTVKP